MGTNFYVHNPALREPFHLGKRSAGWPFLLHAEPWWDRRLALRSWTCQALSGRIMDEYEKPISFHVLFFDIMERQRHPRLHPDAFLDNGLQFIPGEFC